MHITLKVKEEIEKIKYKITVLVKIIKEFLEESIIKLKNQT